MSSNENDVSKTISNDKCSKDSNIPQTINNNQITAEINKSIDQLIELLNKLQIPVKKHFEGSEETTKIINNVRDDSIQLFEILKISLPCYEKDVITALKKALSDKAGSDEKDVIAKLIKAINEKTINKETIGEDLMAAILKAISEDTIERINSDMNAGIQLLGMLKISPSEYKKDILSGLKKFQGNLEYLTQHRAVGNIPDAVINVTSAFYAIDRFIKHGASPEAENKEQTNRAPLSIAPNVRTTFTAQPPTSSSKPDDECTIYFV